MTVDTQKLRGLIAAVHEASDIHGEQAWYEPPGTLYIDPDGVGKADFDYIAYLSPGRVSALLDELEIQREIEARNASLDKECGRLERENDRLRAELQARQWQPIETAPHETLVVLGWHDENGVFKQEIALASAGTRYPGGASDMWWHGRATHWMPLDLPPAPPQGEKHDH